MMTTPVVQSLFEKVNVRAFVEIVPADGGTFILEDDINKPGQVLEVAARTPNRATKAITKRPAPGSSTRRPSGPAKSSTGSSSPPTASGW
jgi:hypothetical protein